MRIGGRGPPRRRETRRPAGASVALNEHATAPSRGELPLASLSVSLPRFKPDSIHIMLPILHRARDLGSDFFVGEGRGDQREQVRSVAFDENPVTPAREQLSVPRTLQFLFLVVRKPGGQNVI